MLYEYLHRTLNILIFCDVAMSEEHKPVKVEDFPEHIALMQSKKSIQFEKDYESVMIDVDFSQHASKLHVNASKNRYKNIIPCECQPTVNRSLVCDVLS